MSPEAPKQMDSELKVHPESTSLGNLSLIREEMIKTMEGIANLMERGSSATLLVLGSFIAIFVLFSKLQPFSLFYDLSSADFIWALLVALILLLAGCGIRVYQFRVEQEFGRLVRDSGIALVSKGMDAGASLVTSLRRHRVAEDVISSVVAEL